ncbi:MAG: ubiquinol-cytochrome C chaperone family protein [Magnetospiraceae bacterium]
MRILFQLFGFRDKALQEPAQALYAAAVTQARQEPFYTVVGVPDTLEARIELVMCHVHLILRRLKREGAACATLSQYVFDEMFQDLDRNLRASGVSDIKIGRKMKKLGRAFFGRIAAYDSGLDSADAVVLADAIDRNIFEGIEAPAGAPQSLAAYLMRSDQTLRGQELADLQSGKVQFPNVSPDEAV